MKINEYANTEDIHKFQIARVKEALRAGRVTQMARKKFLIG